MTEETRPETYDAPMLDIGGDIGALIIYTDPDLDNAEIEISPTAELTARTHNQVHPRRAPAGLTYSAVFPTVPAGDYTLWRDATTTETTVTIHGGHITEYHWRGPRPTPHHHHH
ncbi:MAG: hypothetical protein ACRDRN_03970 [Sciscionella sp.]